MAQGKGDRQRGLRADQSAARRSARGRDGRRLEGGRGMGAGGGHLRAGADQLHPAGLRLPV